MASSPVRLTLLRSRSAFDIQKLSSHYFSFRHFSVKELLWCAPSESPNKKRRENTRNNSTDDDSENNASKLIEFRFGIVAAAARENNVIGVNGKLPWNLPEDREAFKSLTRNKILVIGRRTFEEQENQCHISHCAHSIIVSNSLKWIESAEKGNSLHMVRSFDEALQVANTLATEQKDAGSNTDPDDLVCWVAGGERLYQDALKHPSAERVHLTLVDKTVPITGVEDYARFPSRYRWDNKFRIISREKHVSTKGDAGVTYETLIYKRIRSKR